MPATLEYLRPTTLDDALTLLRRPGLRTVPLAGGVWLVPRLRRERGGARSAGRAC